VLMASSKPVSDVALNSVTRAILMIFASLLNPGLPLIYPVCSLNGLISNIRVGGLRCRLSSFEGKEGVERKEVFNSAEEQYSEEDRAYRVA
jgi:hypothetical protein